MDCTTELPDDVLVSIISRLSLQEATITSVLSRRWKGLCYKVTRLDFNQKKFDLITTILDKHKGNKALLEFKAKLRVLKDDNIDPWFEFALSSQVEILDVHLELYGDKKTHGRCHVFPIEALIEKKGLNSLPGLGTLKVLSLINVDVDDRGAELLLSNTNRLLERLTLSCSNKLENLSVVDRPSLKHLEVYGTRSSKYVKSQSAINIELGDLTSLVSFKYRGRREIDLIVGNVPKLTEVEVEGTIYHMYLELLPRLSCCIHQIVHLKLVVHPWISSMRWNWYTWSQIPNMLPGLVNLKHLVLEAFIVDEPYAFGLIALIKASPFLEKLVVKFLRESPVISEPIEQRYWWFATPEGCFWEDPHYNLTTVKLSGFYGSNEEVNFALYIVMNAVKLQEFFVEVCRSTPFGNVPDVAQDQATALWLNKFQSMVRESVKLMVI